MNTSIKLTASALVVLGMILAGCAETMQKPSASLYDRLGGKGAITAVVDDFLTNLAQDPRINTRFAAPGSATNQNTRAKLIELICAGTGGPCTYTGLDMKTAHAGMIITDAEFGALVEDLVKTLDKFKVPAQEKNELLGILGPMKKDIVGV